MPNKKIKNLRGELHQFIINNKDEIVPMHELSILYRKYVEYQNTKKNDNLDNDRKIIFFLLEKLYVANCSDLDLISTIIERMHGEGIWFNSIISDLFIESKNFQTDEIIQLLEYCLKYTYKKKTLFNGYRMATLSDFFTLLFPDTYYTSSLPNVIGILLQYGMLLDPITGQTPILLNSSNHSENIASTVNVELNRDWGALWHSIITEGIILHNPKFLPIKDLPDTQKQIVNISVKVANMFMRESVQFKLKDFYFSMAKQEFFETHPLNPNRCELVLFVSQRIREFNPPDAVQFILKLGRPVPELPLRCFEPMSLKCVCKRKIRKLLDLNWQLPCGIYKLDVPKSIMRYLNLEIN